VSGGENLESPLGRYLACDIYRHRAASGFAQGAPGSPLSRASDHPMCILDDTVVLLEGRGVVSTPVFFPRDESLLGVEETRRTHDEDGGRA